jgi:hypothetical protein
MYRAYKECKKNWVSRNDPAREIVSQNERTTVLLTDATDGGNERVQAPRRRREAQEREALVLRFKQKCAAKSTCTIFMSQAFLQAGL